jgi:hypothetical protein
MPEHQAVFWRASSDRDRAEWIGDELVKLGHALRLRGCNHARLVGQRSPRTKNS